MRPQIDWRKLYSRLLTAGMILTLAALTVVAVYIFLAYRTTAQDLIIERDRQLTYLSAARLRDELGKFTDELSAVARIQPIYGGNLEAQRRALQDSQNRLVVFDGGVVLLDNFGRVRLTQPPRPDLIDQDWSDRDFFRGLLDPSSTILSDLMEDPADGSLGVVMSVPVTGEGGELIGVLAGMFELGASTTSSFYASVIRLRIGQSGTTYLVDGTGRVLYDSDYNVVGEPLAMPGLPADALRGQVGAVRTRDAAGNEVVAAYAPVPGTNWVLVTEDDWNLLFGPVQRYGRFLLLVLALGMTLPALGVATLVRLQHLTVLEREHSAQEMRVASLIQEMLVPEQLPVVPGWDLAAHYQAGPEGGRDFFDLGFRPDGRLMLAVAETPDRGIQAAHLISATRAVLRGTAQRRMCPHEALACTNELLCPDTTADLVVDCAYAVLDPPTGNFSFSLAGHLATYHWNGGHLAAYTESGAPLGTDLTTTYRETMLALNPADVIVMCSDGLMVAQGVSGKDGATVDIATVLRRPNADARELLAGLRALLNEARAQHNLLEDDVSIIVLKRDDKRTDPGAAA
ncbi:MAG: SpoIIE family protein phosphatase [Caldilineaceae bacterium]|nr:SpoIIE family protein phosphatase [Caldilineaceae bacterium]